MTQLAAKDLQQQKSIQTGMSIKPDQLLISALSLYDKSCSSATESELCVKYRANAQKLAMILTDVNETKADAANLLGRIALDEGFYQKAGHYIDMALTIAPNDPGYLFSKGHQLLSLQKLEEACSYFEAAIAVDTNATKAASSLAYTKYKQNRITEAFGDYRKLIRKFPEDAHVKTKLFECTDKIVAESYQPELEADVISYFHLENVRYSSLANISGSLLLYKYGLENDFVEVNVDLLCQDELFIQSLSKLTFKSPFLENFITRVRRKLFIDSLSNSDLDENHLELASALSLYSSANEHVQFFDQQERNLLMSLNELMQAVVTAPEWKPEDLAGAVVLYSMYQPIHALSYADELARYALGDWPSWVRKTLHHGLHEFIAEKSVVKQIAGITNIDNETSVRVQSQYEAHPYPRWLHLSHNTPTNYGRALEQEFSDFRAPDFFNQGELNVLVAGCGTGQHAIRVAKYFRNVKVLAVDLSLRSLAYAKMMAEKHEVTNIEFMQADILNLDSLNRKFHIIECSGVLHHMADAMEGWMSLNNLLLPGGLIKVGVYSRKARDVVLRSRDIIERNQLDASEDNIRLFRKAILEGSHKAAFRGILNSPDFYNTSGCRDLLFHEHESQYDPNQLQKMIQNLDLNFIGFVLETDIRQKFGVIFDDESKLKDLSAWAEFEQLEPEAFANMYQFYCQKPFVQVH